MTNDEQIFMTNHALSIAYRWNMICVMIKWGLIRNRTWDELDKLFKVKNPMFLF